MPVIKQQEGFILSEEAQIILIKRGAKVFLCPNNFIFLIQNKKSIIYILTISSSNSGDRAIILLTKKHNSHP